MEWMKCFALRCDLGGWERGVLWYAVIAYKALVVVMLIAVVLMMSVGVMVRGFIYS